MKKQQQENDLEMDYLIDKYLKDIGFRGDKKEKAKEILRKRYINIEDMEKLKDDVKRVKEGANLLTNWGAMARLVRQIEDEINKVDIKGFVLKVRSVERGNIIDLAIDKKLGSILITSDINTGMDLMNLKICREYFFSGVNQSRGDTDFYIFRNDSKIEQGKESLNIQDFATNLEDVNEEGVYLIRGVIGRTRGKYASGVEISPIREGEEIKSGDIINKKGELNLRIFITDGNTDVGVKIKSVACLSKLLSIDIGRVVDFLRGEKAETMRILRDELSGKNVSIFGRGSKYSPSGEVLDTAWMDITKFGWIEIVED